MPASEAGGRRRCRFFFSSRRRHTRWTGDWSSDVCSSDLMPACLVPQCQFYAVPEPQLVVDGPEIVLDDVFCGPDFIGDFFIFESLSDEFDEDRKSVV